ncbi:MAG: hypothetical protein CL707_03320 [Chloroflexi bacterium]|nr:hypothetical protein [Chloroflexota bacterium]|tara:strand:- start:29 stop:457 length:429 start_codon:yes stop_codon:yes gene_type:complete
MKKMAIKYHQQVLSYGITLGAFLILIILSMACSETLDHDAPQEQYILTEDSPIVVLPDSEIQVQFIEVFNESQCKKGSSCNITGKGKVMIGISGPGLMPFPTELTVGIVSNALLGYSVTIDKIDRTKSLDAVTVTIRENQTE